MKFLILILRVLFGKEFLKFLLIAFLATNKTKKYFAWIWPIIFFGMIILTLENACLSLRASS